jgi:hypothetical protein
MQTLNRCKLDWMAFVTLVHFVALAAVALAVSIWSFWPIVGCLLVPILLDMLPILTELRMRHWRRQITLHAQLGFNRRDFTEVVRQLDWGPIPSSRKDHWLKAVAEESSRSFRPRESFHVGVS